jgi:hypothetical protein
MNSCKEFQDLILEDLYQNLDGADQARLHEHLAVCPRCAAALQKSGRTLQIMDRREIPALPESYWEKNELRILEKVQKNRMETALPVFRRRNTLTWGTRFAAAVAILTIGILIGRLTFHGGIQGSGSRDQIVSTETPFHLAELQQRTNQYLDRSKMIILGLINFDSGSEDPYILNMERNQRISGELIQEAGFLKENLECAGQNRLSELVSELELILMQIANLDRQEHIDGLELIKDGVDRNSLLMKIDVEKMRQTSTESSQYPDVDIHTS